MKISKIAPAAALLTSLAIGPEAAAQQWVEMSATDSPLVFQLGGKASAEEQHFTIEQGLPGKNGPTYYGVFIVEPEVSQLTIYLDRLGPKPSGTTRNLSLDEKNVAGRNARNFAYINCRYDACANYQMGDVALCAAFSLDENPTPDQWRRSRNDRLQGFFCTKRKVPVTAEMIDRVLAGLTVRARAR